MALLLLLFLPQGFAAASLPAGLWVGDAIVVAVSEIVPSRPTGENTNVPVPSEGRLPMRVLLHSDGSGDIHLLKWVTLMAREVQNNDSEISYEEILVTSKSVFFKAGIVGRFPDGDERLGYRFFTTAFDWNESNSSNGNQLPLSVMDQTITGTLILGAQHPSNPFYHRFHNMHQDGRDVTRTVRFSWKAVEDGNASGIGGFDRITGLYEENIYGLNGKPQDPTQPQTSDPHIALEGQFELRRISEVSALNGN